MSGRDLIRMTDDEVGAFLAEPGRNLCLATINADGTPHLVAMSYGLLDGELVMWSYRKAQKVVNLQRDPRVTVLLETGQRYEELRGVQITGRAELVEDTDRVREVGRRIAAHSLGGKLAEGSVPDTAPERVAIVVKPGKVISWDHAKLEGRY